MGETTSHPLVYDATPRVNPPHRPRRRRPRGRFWGTPPANVVAFADICFPLSDAFSTSNGKSSITRTRTIGGVLPPPLPDPGGNHMAPAGSTMQPARFPIPSIVLVIVLVLVIDSGGFRHKPARRGLRITSVCLSVTLPTSNGKKLDNENENDDEDDWGGTTPLPARCAPSHSC
jgi:hypothetical protein